MLKPSALFGNAKFLLSRYNYKAISVSWLSCVLIFSCVFFVFLPDVEYNFRSIHFSLRESYDYIFITENKPQFNSFYYYVGSSITLFNSNGSILQAEVIMQTDNPGNLDRSFRRFTDILASNEIAISKNLARRNGLQIGDSMLLTHPSFATDINVVITAFFDDAFGISRRGRLNGVVIMGHHNNIAESTLRYISFVGDEIHLYEEFFSDFIQNQAHYLLHDQIEAHYKDVIISLIILFVTIFVLQFTPCYIFICKRCEVYYRRHILQGRNISSIKSETLLDCLVICIPIILTSFVVNISTIFYSLGIFLVFQQLQYFFFN